MILLLQSNRVQYWLLGYNEVVLQERLRLLNQQVDSLFNEARMCYTYVDRLRRVLQNPSSNTETASVHTTELPPSSRAESSSSSLHPGLSAPSFVPPALGLITNTFNLPNGHLGVDIAVRAGSPVVAAADGTVIFSDWTMETGYTIAIAHSGGWISFYKHNQALLKKVGDRVHAGEPIALAGGTGLLARGPHLHFELWHDGTAIDPLQVIHF